MNEGGAVKKLGIYIDNRGVVTVKKDDRDITSAVTRVEMTLSNGAVLEAKVDVRYPDKVVTETWA